ncbi:hypothetical protein WG907_04390 [Sphingobium sp. AN558]|uniref:hypothetical protein n=1 Tax=Sphingobium sp. AN558 TaxID=3133442 RepID=UPI0030BFC8FC
MDMAAAFADIGLAFSAAFGGPFWPAQIITQGELEYDDGGSIIPGTGEPVRRDCMAQVDAVSEAMRLQEGFAEKDRRIIVLAATLEGGVTTADKIEILEGPFAAIWSIEFVGMDTVAAGRELRGRAA